MACGDKENRRVRRGAPGGVSVGSVLPAHAAAALKRRRLETVEDYGSPSDGGLLHMLAAACGPVVEGGVQPGASGLYRSVCCVLQIAQIQWYVSFVSCLKEF